MLFFNSLVLNKFDRNEEMKEIGLLILMKI